MKVVNLLGGPSSTKSTTAAGVFYELKSLGYKVEYVSEFAKDLVWEERYQTLKDDQLYVLGEQNHRLHRLRNKVDWVITDTSLLLSLIYGDENWPATTTLRKLSLEVYNTYDNINYFIERPDTFEKIGRVHNLQQSLEIDNQIKQLMQDNNISYTCVKAGKLAVDTIAHEISFFDQQQSLCLQDC